MTSLISRTEIRRYFSILLKRILFMGSDLKTVLEQDFPQKMSQQDLARNQEIEEILKSPEIIDLDRR